MIIMLNHADKVQYILDNLEELDGWDSPADTYLQSFWSIPDEIPRAALAAEKYDPAMIYYHAAADVRDELLSRYRQRPQNASADLGVFGYAGRRGCCRDVWAEQLHV